MFSNINLIAAADKLIDAAYKQCKTNIFHSKTKDEAIHHLAYGKGYLHAIYDIIAPYLLDSEKLSLFYQISYYISQLSCDFEKYFKPLISSKR